MWTKKEQRSFDAAVWRGPVDLATATVRISVLLGLGLLWLSLVVWIFFSG